MKLKKLTAALMTLALVIGLLPTAVRADNGNTVDLEEEEEFPVEIGTITLPDAFYGDGPAGPDDATRVAMNVLFGESRYSLGRGSGDFDDDWNTDLNDTTYCLFHVVFTDPSHSLARYVAAAYDANGRMTGVRVISDGEILKDGDFDFLKSAAIIRFFYLDNSGAPMAKMSEYRP